MRRLSSTVSSGNVPRPWGTWAMPSAHDRLGRRLGDVLAVERDRARARGSSPRSPASSWSCRPRWRRGRPRSRRRRPSRSMSWSTFDRAVAGAQPADLEAATCRHVTSSPRGRPRSRAGRFCTSAGMPSAILRPKSIATTLVGDPHHHRHVVLDEQHGERRTRRGCRRIVSPSSSTSPWVSPDAGSSISRNRGRAASARAISSRFSVPNGSPAAGRNISGAEAELVEQLAGEVARRGGSRRPRRCD